MKRLICLLGSLAFAFALSCGGDDDSGNGGGGSTDTSNTQDDTGGGGGGGGDANVKTVCEKVFECGGWGWQSQEECEAGWFGDNDTMCASTSGYLGCVPDCLDKECTELQQCEGQCWTDHCD